jgi:signal transduction histidine kinase
MSKARTSSDRQQPKQARSGRKKSGPSDHAAKLRTRLKTAEETLGAIRSGEVDAVMVSGRHGDQVVTLTSGAPTYRMLVEAMSEGAAILTGSGALLYSNLAFAELISGPPRTAGEISVQSLVGKSERQRFESLLATAQKGVAKGEFTLNSGDGRQVPVHLSLNRLRGYEGVLGMVVTDLTGSRLVQAQEIKQADAMRRLLLERVLSAQEGERRRIARELHDEAGQLLTSLLVGLRALEDARSLADARTMGSRLREITAQAIDEVGRLARGLHPTVLDDHGLGVALSRYAAEYTRIHNIAVDLTLNEWETSALPPAFEIGLYRILQEALTNVAKHSGASAVGIEFARTGAGLEVSVSDDGCGFDTESAAIVSSSRLGIQSIRERAAMLNGSVRFISEDKGTRILVLIPLIDREAHDQKTPERGAQPFAGRTKL